MPTVTATQIPPLPANTAGRWLDVIREDTDMVRRWLNVVYQMDTRYRMESVAGFGYCMAHRPTKAGASFYYWQPSHEVVVRLLYTPIRGKHAILSAGFVGDITPAAALDLMVDRAISYLRDCQTDSAYAIVPKQTENPNIVKLYDLLPTHPRVRATLEAESPGVKRWGLFAPELRKP